MLPSDAILLGLSRFLAQFHQKSLVVDSLFQFDWFCEQVVTKVNHEIHLFQGSFENKLRLLVKQSCSHVSHQ